ncbi:hypothetical protein AG1IA_09511 [Rhizoctonia solani AG-1 IA]|uniref:Uncharacterized protein n=1 Tax=Thanatephorus cucumeris (strain AG1-IA) TaxID=983506 RepID=L8WE53_THACA|nr:hypothetical protein AG1IA_09511 [Rhizoctonia solani AG-1 IA]
MDVRWNRDLRCRRMGIIFFARAMFNVIHNHALPQLILYSISTYPRMICSEPEYLVPIANHELASLSLHPIGLRALPSYRKAVEHVVVATWKGADIGHQAPYVEISLVTRQPFGTLALVSSITHAPHIRYTAPVRQAQVRFPLRSFPAVDPQSRSQYRFLSMNKNTRAWMPYDQHISTAIVPTATPQTEAPKVEVINLRKRSAKVYVRQGRTIRVSIGEKDTGSGRKDIARKSHGLWVPERVLTKDIYDTGIPYFGSLWHTVLFRQLSVAPNS